ncbi:hypothetical protein H4W30_001491 [Amycolatopsis roodepoortensis]|uniref:Transposase n=1 Tax=Amycolatopsis roodepoortensis TaxID=700274 RepID=A0ABR9L1H0_9PSEU|nr:hypothetical protein [Amycolatopsis roodepoortensis]
MRNTLRVASRRELRLKHASYTLKHASYALKHASYALKHARPGLVHARPGCIQRTKRGGSWRGDHLQDTVCNLVFG